MPKKIMVVDNEPDTVDMVKAILEDGGFVVVTAYSGTECLKKVEVEKPDLILLDIMMPDLSGWDVYNRLRKTDKETKVSFLSAIEVSRERMDKLLQSGLSDYITKPFTADELLERVGRILPK
jgi:two-component system response regulator VicR